MTDWGGGNGNGGGSNFGGGGNGGGDDWMTEEEVREVGIDIRGGTPPTPIGLDPDTGGAAGEESSVIKQFKDALGIETSTASQTILGPGVGELQALMIELERALGINVVTRSHQLAERERFQGDFANDPNYAEVEAALFAEGNSRALGAGVDPLSPEGIEIREQVFTDARAMAHSGFALSAVQRVIQSQNPYTIDVDDPNLPPEDRAFFGAEPMPNPFMGPPAPKELEFFRPQLPLSLPDIQANFSLPGGRGILSDPQLTPETAGALYAAGVTLGPDGIWRSSDDQKRFLGESATPIGGGSGNDPPGLYRFWTNDGHQVSLFVGSDGTLRNPVPILEGLAAKIRTGGALTANERALLKNMTSEQLRASGIFVTRTGTVIPTNEVLERALVNAAAGKPLTINQQTALGLVFLNTPNVGGAHRDLVSALSGNLGREVRANISAAVQDSLGVAINTRRAARAQTEAAQRGTPARIAENAIGRLQAGQGLTANQQQLFARLTRAERTALLDDALAPRGKPNIVANIVARATNRQPPTAAQREFLASLPPQQRALIRTTAEQAVTPGARGLDTLRAAGVPNPERALATLRAAGIQSPGRALLAAVRSGAPRPIQAVIAQTPAAAARTAQRAAERLAVRPRAPIAAVASRSIAAPLRTLPAAQQQAVLLQRAVSRRQAGMALTPLQRTALAQSTAAERRPLAAQARAAQAARTAQAAAAQSRAATARLAEARTAAQRQQAAARAAAQQRTAASAQRSAQAAQQATTARAAQQAAQVRAQRARAPIAAVAPRNLAVPLRALSQAQQQRVLLTRAASRQQTGVQLTTAQREAQQRASAAERARQAQVAQRAATAQAAAAAAAQRARAAAQAAQQRAQQAAAMAQRTAQQRTAQQQAARQASQRAAEQAAQQRAAAASAARRAAAAPRSTGPLRNLSAAEQQRVLLTRAVARRQAGAALTPAQLAALRASTPAQRRTVR